MLGDPTGAIRFSWIRRTRLNGDSRFAEVPLGEETEEYAITIIDGSSVVRSVTTAVPVWHYTFEKQLADFATPPEQLTWRVAQLSGLYGPGHAAELFSLIDAAFAGTGNGLIRLIAVEQELDLK
jgi:hypothetical protein